jgi:hypothetical protein
MVSVGQDEVSCGHMTTGEKQGKFVNTNLVSVENQVVMLVALLEKQFRSTWPEIQL